MNEVAQHAPSILPHLNHAEGAMHIAAPAVDGDVLVL